jgi:hypothetical protein
MRLAWISAVAAAATLFLAPGSLAFAQSSPTPDAYVPEAQQSRVGIDVDFLHTRGNDLLPPNIVTADLVAQIGVTRHIFLDADISWGVVGWRGDPKVVWGNPMLGAHYAGRLHRRITGYAGVAVGIPVGGASDSHAVDQLGAQAAAARALHDPYRFFPHSVPLVARAGLEADLAPVFLRADLSPGLIVDPFNALSTGYADTGATVGLRARFGLEGGLRVRALFIFVGTDDRAQTSIEPFIGYSAPERVGVYARYGVLVALDTPLGVEGQGVVTHRFSIGAKF